MFFEMKTREWYNGSTLLCQGRDAVSITASRTKLLVGGRAAIAPDCRSGVAEATSVVRVHPGEIKGS